MTGHRRRRLIAPIWTVAYVALLSACASQSPTARPDTPAPATPGATATASPTQAPLCSGDAASPAPTSGLLHLALSGRGPIDIELQPDTSDAWVIASDSGELIRLDLSRGCETRSFEAGSTLTTLTVGSGEAYVAQLDSFIGDQPLHSVNLADGVVDHIATNPIGGLAMLNGYVLVLEKSGNVRAVDVPAHTTVGSVGLQVISNEHMEIVSDGAQAWLSSDHTPVRRVSLDESGTAGSNDVDLTAVASIEVGGGIPFDVDAGLIWGARPDELWAIDPATNRVVRHVQLEDLAEILAVDVADGQAWIAARHPGQVGTVIRVDIQSGDVLGEWPVSLPASVKVFGDHAWVASYDTDELIGIPLAE